MRFGSTDILGLFGWVGGATWVMNQPGMTIWDGIIWLYYVGQYVAMHFTVLTLQ